MSTTSPVPPTPALVVGLGSPDRGDDAVGGHVARAVRGVVAGAGWLEVGRSREPWVTVLEHEDPTDLIELWAGHDRVVVVDATCSGAAPGTVVALEAGAEQGLLPADAWARTGRGGTHAFGLAAAVKLARVLGRLPARVTVVGVEAVSFEPGAPLSPAVAAAVPDAVEAVLAAVRTTARTAAHAAGGADVPR